MSSLFDLFDIDVIIRIRHKQPSEDEYLIKEITQRLILKKDLEERILRKTIDKELEEEKKKQKKRKN